MTNPLWQRLRRPHSSMPSIGSLVRRPEVGSLIGMIAVLVFFSIFGGANFMSAGGAASWLNVAAELGIIALPVGLLMIAGHLDLSVGSMVPASSMTIAIVSGHYDLPIIVGILAALGLGLAVGFINGVLVIRTKVPSFVVTLATLFALAGLTLGLSIILSGSTSVALKSGPIAKLVFGDYLGGKFQVTLFWWIAHRPDRRLHPEFLALRQLDLRHGRRRRQRPQCRHPDGPGHHRAVHVQRPVRSLRRHVPGDPLQHRPGGRRAVLHLQLDHRGGHRRRAAHRRLRLGGRHRSWAR